MPVLKFKALLLALEGPGLNMPLLRGQQFLFHAHCAAEPCVLSRLLRTVERDGKTTKERSPRLLVPGMRGVVRCVLARSRCLTTYAESKRLGSFALRYGGTSVAMGVILKVYR
jgi:hypothetical protein